MKDGDTPPAPVALTREEVFDFFATKLPDLKCPACGQEEFEVAFSEDAQFSALLSGSDLMEFSPQSSASFAPAIIVTCNTCFYMLPFSYLGIVNWVAQQKTGGRQ